ncbi:MAG: serine/threonine protein kinase [Chloroflexi bacterium]|nr:MAG: serine/threonine protein kinase [Chloroflexota bacterium]
MAHSHRQTDNPFFNRQRITDPAYFYGREKAVEAMYSAIATRQCRSIVGERKMGKSSLLAHLSCTDSLLHHGFDPKKFVFIYVDMEGMANIAYEEFWPELLDRLEMALPDSQEKLRDQVGDLAMQAEVRFSQVRRVLRRMDRAGLTVVMMLDEFESLAGNEAFNASFYGELRSLAGELGVVYITASKRSLYDLTYQHADTLSSPFFNIFSEEPLDLMSYDEAENLLMELSALTGTGSFTKDECAALIDLAGPHPFFLQVAGYYLCAARRELETDTLLPAKATRGFLAESEDHFRYLWDQLGESEQSTLRHWETATSAALSAGVPDTIKPLVAKCLLKQENGERPRPFGKAFAEFLSRATLTKRPTSTTEATRASTNLTGTTLGNYRVLTPVGQGGMAVVYKGYQSSLDRYVAIKVMAHHLADDRTFIDRFQREASGVAQLRHQNVVQMYDFGLSKGISYMVMEFIEGETLKERLVSQREAGERMPLSDVMQVVRDLAAALDYAHAHSIVHRDVKPTNVMMRQEEQLARLTGGASFAAVLADFGVARMLEGVQLTGTGATIGTPDYMSPEQARGEPAGAQSDVYALGVVLYEMLTGELPFTADTPVAVLLKHMQAIPPSAIMKVPDLPTGVDHVLLKALAKQPAERYATAGRMAEALHSALERYQ